MSCWIAAMVSIQKDRRHGRRQLPWVRLGGANGVRRPFAYSFIAGILLRCREQQVGARSRRASERGKINRCEEAAQ
jgi:hypothetical protein